MEVNFQIYHYWRSQCAMKGVRKRKEETAGRRFGARQSEKVRPETGNERGKSTSVRDLDGLSFKKEVRGS